MKKILVIVLFITLNLQAQIERVEPPMWWADMQLSQVQLMVYGKGISDFHVTSDLEILSIRKTENPNYLFVTVETKDVAPGEYQLYFAQERTVNFSTPFNLVKRKEGSQYRKGFDSSDLIYLIMPDRFANGNPTNDSHPDLVEKADRDQPGGRHGGDIQGIIDHLDYLEELGVTALWSTPLLEDNDKAYSYHTYAQSDVYRIDPRYGTNEDYRRLAKEMHKREMKLIMDYVTNHWGITHWMIQDLPTYDWIHQFPGYANSNYRMTTQYDSNTSKIDKRYNEDGWFVPSMPDLNQSNPLVLQYLIQNAIWWIEYADLDGFRVDTYSYNQKDAIAKWTKTIMDEYPNFNIVGEVWLHNQAQIAYWQKDSKIGALQSFNSHLPSVMDFTLHDAFGTVFNETNPTWFDGMIKIYENVVNDFLYPEINQLLIFGENHDTDRFNQRYPSIKNYKLLMTLLATMRGIPQLYYGSEIGMAGDKSKGDADIRQDFPGGWKEDAQNAFEATSRTSVQNEYFNFTKNLFNWRKDKPVIHFGKTVQFIPEHNVYVYFRYTDDAKVMVVINNNDKDQQLALQRFAEMIGSAQQGFDVISKQPIGLLDTLDIKAKSSMIIEITP